MRHSPLRTKPAGSLRGSLLAVALLTASLCPEALAGVPGAAGISAPSGSSNASAAVQPVPAVDLERFVGQWYEIARIPAWFQSRCAKDTTARYQLRTDGRITVTNRCLTRQGEIDEAGGLARVVDPATKSRLQVSFFSLLGWRPFWGDYWIIGLDPEYRWLVVGDPRRRYGWILSRSPQLEPAQLEAVFAILERNGYSRSRFALTPQHTPQN